MLFGRKGSGKTTLARSILRNHSRSLVIDPHREYTGDAVWVRSLEELHAYVRRTPGRWRIAYSNDRLQAEFDALCHSAHLLGRCLLIIEEADDFCTASVIPEELRRIVQYGRHPDPDIPGAGQVHVLVTSRSPADVHRSLTRNAYEAYCFTTQEPRDLEYLTRYVSKDFADRLPALAPLHYCYQNLWDRTQPIGERALALPTSRNLPAAVV